MQISVREATDADIDAIRGIYNHYVLTSTATFDESEQPYEARAIWLKQHGEKKLPVIVGETDGRVVGWASLSFYHERCAYRTTAECSVYVHHEWHRQGIAGQLLNSLLERAQQLGFHCIVGLVCSENAASLRMCEKFGFRTVGELKEVGRKFDRWLDVTFVQLLFTNAVK